MSEGVGQDVASYSACRFMHVLGCFWLVLILNQFPAVEGLTNISVYARIIY